MSFSFFFVMHRRPPRYTRTLTLFPNTTLVRSQINSNASSPEYSATASVPTVIISAATGTGDGPNGFVVDGTVGGNVTLGNKVNMAGGVDAQSDRKSTRLNSSH